MLTLIFDTNFNKTYIVLKKDNEVITSKIIESDDKNYHSAYLIPTIRDILKENKIQIKDLDGIGVNIGPGSFTGIRAGITIARVLCQQNNTKLVGVNSLEILSKINKDNNKTTVILDARKNKVYFGEFENNTITTYPQIEDKDTLLERIDKNSTIITDSSTYEFLKTSGITLIKYEENDKDLGLYLSEIVKNKLTTSTDDFNWAKVKPLYIQPPSITKPKVK